MVRLTDLEVDHVQIDPQIRQRNLGPAQKVTSTSSNQIGSALEISCADGSDAVSSEEAADVQEHHARRRGWSSSDEDREESNWVRCRMEKRQINPLSVRFSQAVVYRNFHNGGSVEQCIDEIRCRYVTPEPLVDGWLQRFCCRRATTNNVQLYAPFPWIRVLSGSKNLKYLEGHPITPRQSDDKNELLYTIDNRRLFVLQQAALRQWPKRCLVDVLVMERLPYKRHAKKFDNYKNGYTVQFGHGRGSSDVHMWCWFDSACDTESDNFTRPIDCMLILAKIIPAFLLLRDRCKPFLHQTTIALLAALLIWAFLIALVRLSAIANKCERRILQHHVLALVNSDCLSISDHLPEFLAFRLGCPSRNAPVRSFRTLKITWPQICMTVFFAVLTTLPCLIWYMPLYRDRLQRSVVLAVVVIMCCLVKFAATRPSWEDEIKPV